MLLLSSALFVGATALPFTVEDPAAVMAGAPYPVASAVLGQRLEEAAQMSEDRNFRGVIDQLNAIVTAGELPLSPESGRCFLFLLGKAYYETSDSRALSILDRYLAEWPAGEEAGTVRLLEADFYFFAHDWSRALERYNTIDASTLNSADKALYTYRRALCMLKCGFIPESRPLFNSLSSVKAFALPAKYYEAYTYYVEGQDRQAMKLFSEVADRMEGEDPQIVPEYYIAQLIFRQGEWKECAEKAVGLLRRNVNPELAAGTRRIYGLSEYELGNYSKALPILLKYAQESGSEAAHDALYALGVCLYDEGRLSEAEEYFSRVAADSDVIGQGASLFLGQIAAKRDEPSAAAMNFERAYRMNYDNRVAESALYNYVSARARGGNVPFDSNVEMLEEFIRNYPNSEFAPVIERHLATLYYNDGDYDNALRVAKRIDSPSASDKSLLQMILYSAGTSALSSGNPERAAKLLDECVGIKAADESIRAQALIWLGDAEYELYAYDKAERHYDEALNSGRAGGNSVHALYNLGYSRMMQNKFSQAESAFSRMLSSSLEISDDLRRDARLRIADCKYYAGNYAGAKADFANLRTGGHGADYASYRHAQILGIEGNLQDKIAELRSIEKNYGDSRWMPNILNELADTYIAVGNSKEGAAAYSRLLRKYPVDASAPHAQLGLAAALMDDGKKEEGAEAYKEVLRRWPSSSEARIADQALRDYYAELDRLPEYARFLESIPGFSLNAADMETLAYNAAERRYLESPASPQPLRKYLQDYPTGRNVPEALSLLGRHYLEKGDKPNALGVYQELEKRGGAEYAVEAYTGIMRSADNVAVRAEYARKIRGAGGASADVLEEADYYLSENLLRSKTAAERKEGERKFRELSANPFSETGARSAVTLGEYFLENKRPQEALELMEEFTSSGSSLQYWVARGFIVMSDAYKALGDDYMAREYIRSLKRNYPGSEPDIVNAINRRLK